MVISAIRRAVSVVALLALPAAALADEVVFTNGAAWDVGARLDGSAIGARGRKIYTVDFPSLSDTAAGRVHAVDTRDGTVLASIYLDQGFPFDIAASHDGRHVYVAVSRSAGPNHTSGPNRVDVIDTRSDTLIKSILTGGSSNYGPAGIAVSPDDTKAYVGDRVNNVIRVIDLTSHTLAGFIPVAGEPTHVAFSPDGSRAFVGHRVARAVSAIDVATDTLIKMVPVDLRANQNYFSLGIHPDGKRLFVTSLLDNRIAVVDIDPTSHNDLRQVRLLHTPLFRIAQVEVSPDGRLGFITGLFEGRVLVIGMDPIRPDYLHQIHQVRVPGNPIDLSIVKGDGGRSKVFAPAVSGKLLWFEYQWR